VSDGQGGTVKIDVYGGEIKSEFAAGNIEGYLKEYRDGIVAKRLETNSLPANLLRPFQVRERKYRVSGEAGGRDSGRHYRLRADLDVPERRDEPGD